MAEGTETRGLGNQRQAATSIRNKGWLVCGLDGKEGLSQTEGVWTLSLGAVESQENGFGEVGSPIATRAVLGPTAAQNGLDSRCQPLCLSSAMVCVVSGFVFNYFYQCPPDNNLEDCEEVAGGGGSHRFYGLDRTVALCLE